MCLSRFSRRSYRCHMSLSVCHMQKIANMHAGCQQERLSIRSVVLHFLLKSPASITHPSALSSETVNWPLRWQFIRHEHNCRGMHLLTLTHPNFTLLARRGIYILVSYTHILNVFVFVYFFRCSYLNIHVMHADLFSSPSEYTSYPHRIQESRSHPRGETDAVGWPSAHPVAHRVPGRALRVPSV